MTTAIISYRKNPNYSEIRTPDLPRLFAELDLSGYQIKTPVRSLPVYYRKLDRPVGPVRVVYTTRMAGLTLEAGNLNRLEQAIDDTLKSMIRLEHLPEFFFRVGDVAWPIYHLADELTTRYPGGPVFTTQDIASLRLWLADHFKAIGRIKNRREMDLLYLSPDDLQLFAPYCVFRTPDEAVPDIPVFPVRDQGKLRLMAPVKNTSLNVDYAGGKGIFTLFSQVADYWIENGQLDDPYEITIRKISSDAWNHLETKLSPDHHNLTYTRSDGVGQRKVQNPVYVEDQFYVAARTNRVGRTVLYLAADVIDLRKRVASELHSYGAIQDPDGVKAIVLDPKLETARQGVA